MATLELIYKKHQLWINYLYKNGCPYSLCEDLVQEMYIKIDTYLKKNNNSIRYKDDINVYFIFLTLRSLFTDYIRKSNKIKIIEFQDYMLEKDQEIFDQENDILDIDTKQKVINDWYNDDMYLELLEKENINSISYTKEEMEKYYFRKIFKEIFYNKVQISKLAKDTNITYWSLRNTIKIIKKQIRKKYETRKSIRKDI